jgi:hypothetical protein
MVKRYVSIDDFFDICKPLSFRALYFGTPSEIFLILAAEAGADLIAAGLRLLCSDHILHHRLR